MRKVFNVLFLCTGNSARSIMAEAILNKEGSGRFRAFSAGSQPKTAINPFALRVLKSHGCPADGLIPKGWEVFAKPGAPAMDFIVTVCANAAGEACPVWPGQPISAHWGIEDPAAVTGSDAQKEAAFEAVFGYLKSRIAQLTSLPAGSLDRIALQARLRDTGQTGGVSPDGAV